VSKLASLTALASGAMGCPSLSAGTAASHYADLFDSELDQASDALNALTEIVGDGVSVQNMSTGPDPRSDRAL
jgi:hypothetical protein